MLFRSQITKHQWRPPTMAPNPNYTPVVQAVHDALPETPADTPNEALTEHVKGTTAPEDAFNLAYAIAASVRASVHLHAVVALRTQPTYTVHNEDVDAESRAVTVHLHSANESLSKATERMRRLDRHPPIVPAMEYTDDRPTAREVLNSTAQQVYQFLIEAEIQPLVFRTDSLPEAQPLSTASLKQLLTSIQRAIISMNQMFASLTEHMITSPSVPPQPVPTSIDTGRHPETAYTADTITDSPFTVPIAPTLTHE